MESREFVVVHPSTGRDFVVRVDIDVHALLRMYAHRAMDNKSGKARVANGAIVLKAEKA